MEGKVEPVPDDMSIAEAGEFWDTHSVADYPSRGVELDYRPEGRSTYVAVETNLLERLYRRAKEAGISVETLINLWLQEKLQEKLATAP